MASGALPTHRYRKDSRAASALYQPRRPGGPARRLWDTARNLVAPRGRAARLAVYLVVSFVVLALLVPLPGLSSSEWRGAVKLLPGFGRDDDGLATAEDILRYVDPLIGTAGGGHVFAGATVPYGMAKPVADSVDRRENAGGFVQDFSLISGFSQLHDSGRLFLVVSFVVVIVVVVVVVSLTSFFTNFQSSQERAA